MKRHTCTYLLLSSLIVATGCAVMKVQETGFLHDYSLLKALPNAPETQYYETDCALWKKYHKVIVAPVEIHFTKNAQAKVKNVEIPEVQELAEFFRQAMIDALKDRYKVTTEPGNDVLLVRTAIVDVKPVDVVANVISKAILYLPVDLGEAAIEGELTDSLTGERYAAIVDRKIGSILSITGAYSEWGATKNAFEDWAEQLSNLLKDTLHRNTQAIEAFHVRQITPNITQLQLTFAGPPTISKLFATQQPPRISIDFEQTRNGLKKTMNPVNTGSLDTIAVVEDGCHTRVVLQLNDMQHYETTIRGNTLLIDITP